MDALKPLKGTPKTAKKKSESMYTMTIRRLKKNKLAVIGLFILVVMILIAIFAPYLTPYDYQKTDLFNTFASPSREHPFGTDELGRDILTRLMVGNRYSLSIGLITVAISAVLGIAIGAVCGYFGGKFDSVVMRLMDIFQAVPALILAIAISAALGTGYIQTIIAISVSGIPAFVRMARACVLNIRKMEYLEAATAINCTTSQIILKHIIPNTLAPLIVEMTMTVAGNIMYTSSLSFIGLGVQPPNPEWGAMLSAGRNYIRSYPYMVLFPGITIMLCILSLNMLGDGLRDALDPKLKD